MAKAKKLEDWISVLALLAMALLPLLEIAVRRVDPGGIPGAAMWVQHLVLWVGFLGAALGARKGELLSLTAGAGLLGRGRLRKAGDFFACGVGFAVCMALASASLDLMVAERAGGRELALGLPVWVAEAVMPVGFVVIAWRILARAPGGWRGRLGAALFLLVPVALWAFEDLAESGVALPLLVGVLAAVVLGAPIFVGLGGVAALLLWSNFDPVSAIAVETYSLSISPILPTVPLFTLAGYVLAEGGTPSRLVGLFQAWFGWIPGGVAIVAILVCAFFTSFTGGSGVTILAMGGLLYPMLVKDGHTPSFGAGLLTSAGSLGLLLPPSLAVILYGLVAQIDIRRLFAAGLVPAVLEIGLVSVFALSYSGLSGRPRVAFDWKTALRASWRAKWEALIPVVVLGSILGGFATLVEASAVMVLYAVVLEFVVRRQLRLGRDLARVCGDAAALIGGVLLILGMAKGLSNYLIIAEVPTNALDWVQTFVESRLVFLLLLNLFLLVVGCLMDIYSAIAVVVPLIVPLGAAYGVDPFHLGIIFLTNLELGYLTPPVGMNLFLASYRFKRPLPEIYRSATPFLAIRALAVLLVTYLPWLTSLGQGLFEFD